MSLESEFEYSLKQVKDFFNAQDIFDEKISNRFIEKYYTKSEKGYRFFHSLDGCVHMALNFDGNFSEEGYYAQAKIVEEYLKKIKGKKTLELGSGKGFNSIYLARKNKNVSFAGIDLSQVHYKKAKRKGRSLKNLKFKKGDFAKIPFSDNIFDVVFEVESVCHALNMRSVLKEVYRVLSPGGIFILFDGFRKENFKNLDKDLREASILVEKSMAVNVFDNITEWRKIAQETGFKIEKQEDISVAIMPTALKLQRLAKNYFRHKFLSRVIFFIFPSLLIRNSIAGLLIPYTLESGAHGYYEIVLKKPMI